MFRLPLRGLAVDDDAADDVAVVERDEDEAGPNPGAIAGARVGISSPPTPPSPDPSRDP